jgi:hypothetical protein
MAMIACQNHLIGKFLVVGNNQTSLTAGKCFGRTKTKDLSLTEVAYVSFPIDRPEGMCRIKEKDYS